MVETLGQSLSVQMEKFILGVCGFLPKKESSRLSGLKLRV